MSRLSNFTCKESRKILPGFRRYSVSSSFTALSSSLFLMASLTASLNISRRSCSLISNLPASQLRIIRERPAAFPRHRRVPFLSSKTVRGARSPLRKRDFFTVPLSIFTGKGRDAAPGRDLNFSALPMPSGLARYSYVASRPVLHIARYTRQHSAQKKA